jgi:hypothetical protein
MDVTKWPKNALFVIIATVAAILNRYQSLMKEGFEFEYSQLRGLIIRIPTEKDILTVLPNVY